jgi:hypothetical protein
MSSKNNVNKDFYTMAGRDRPNEVVIEPKHRPDELPGHHGAARPNFIPGAAPVGETPPPKDGEALAAADQARPAEGEAHAESEAHGDEGEALADEREPQMPAGKTGTRADSQKQATARRGGKAPGKARPKAGAFGDARRKSRDTVRPKRGAKRAA